MDSDEDDYNDFEEFGDEFRDDEDESKFAEEFHAGDRAGYGGDIEFLETEEMEGMKKTPIERLINKIDTLCNNLNVTKNDKSNIKRVLVNEEVDKPTYKNPLSFILGYLATDGGSRQITNESFINIYDEVLLPANLKEEDQKNITPYDIIRYARLWVNIKRNQRD